MKGVVLAGGLGTRLGILTQITNKHLLPIGSKPMIFYPIETLINSGIKDLMLITSGPHAGHFLPILKNGKELGLDNLQYGYQHSAIGGIAEALSYAEDFVNKKSVAVILGDNTMDINMGPYVKDFTSGAQIFLKEVDNPQDFGVPKFEDGKISEIIEKPENPPSNYAVIGFYLFDSQVFDFIKKCQPSKRGQLEIVDILNMYLEKKQLNYKIVDGFWCDAGQINTYTKAFNYWANKNMDCFLEGLK